MRRTWLSLMVAAAAVTLPATASAGVVLGLGTGVVKPTGSIGGTDKMSDAVSVMFPVELQAGWKFADQLTLAGFLQMDFGVVGGAFKDSCDASGADCLVSQARAGVQARWNFLPTARFDPWVGLGFARETFAMERTSASSGTTSNLTGFAADAMAGADYWIAGGLTISPWLGVSFGKYTRMADVAAMDPQWTTIQDQKIHGLVTAGVRLGWTFGAPPRATGAAPAATAAP